jgi:arylformamidase
MPNATSKQRGAKRRQAPVLLDITRGVNPQLASWPGDVPFTRTWSLRLGEPPGGSEEGGEPSVVNLGAFRQSTHVGTHADAPLHTEPEGASTSDFDLTAFLGPADVIDARNQGMISRGFLKHAIKESLQGDLAPRVLFRTEASEAPSSVFVYNFPPMTDQAIDLMAKRGVVLVGTDAPSVDPISSDRLDAHHALNRHGIVNLENLFLPGVSPGRYELIALPMRLEGMDAAPVRAVLRET